MQEDDRRDNSMLKCRRVREQLSRFIDRDLSPRESAHITTHLKQCVDCRKERETLEALRTGIRNTAWTMDERSQETMRLRAFSRLRANLAEGTPLAPTGRKLFNHFSLWQRRWQPVVTSVLAAGIVAGAVFLVPTQDQEAFSPTMTENATVIPSENELMRLYQLHEANGLHHTVDESILSRSRVADAHAALIEHHDSYESPESH
jgi:hypothetical protein